MSRMNNPINNYRNVNVYHDSNESCSSSNTDSIESNNDRDDIECNHEYPNEHHEQIKAKNIEKQINEVRSYKHLKYLTGKKISENSIVLNNTSEDKNNKSINTHCENGNKQVYPWPKERV